MTLKKEILTYAYSYCIPHVFDTININIRPHKDNLSDLIESDRYLYNVIKNNVKNEDLLRRIEEAISTDKKNEIMKEVKIGNCFYDNQKIKNHIVNLFTNEKEIIVTYRFYSKYRQSWYYKTEPLSLFLISFKYGYNWI